VSCVQATPPASRRTITDIAPRAPAENKLHERAALQRCHRICRRRPAYNSSAKLRGRESIDAAKRRRMKLFFLQVTQHFADRLTLRATQRRHLSKKKKAENQIEAIVWLDDEFDLRRHVGPSISRRHAVDVSCETLCTDVTSCKLAS
jgi:hypothetical protein